MRGKVSSRRVRVWDPLVRLVHWSLVAGFLANYFLTEGGERWHQWIGYGVAALIGVRILWGFVGPWSARWTSFWPTPERLRASLRPAAGAGTGAARSNPGITHTPLGAVMMLTLLALLLGLGATGYMMEETDLFWGVAWVEEAHELMSDAILALVPLHVLGALWESRKRQDNLIAGMVHGYHRPPGPPRSDA
ncbi:cytochrome b/b6 domain-containing protein [Halomonas saccharevitans]|uniref:Cytochrome b/b6 domain-containing protein n=1 Tax=Halomonas saccharevitans TaxID=416872 RepID=A0ABU3NDR2_9GAMM|nr:cytochrome b/b6 domain-containing protein [Halomonas saccharevitans]MDT8879321.1 cytochrome b/b6 domain-containing protein [Halomonas saccharevitans]